MITGKKNLFVISSPSGGGKSTIAKFLMQTYPQLAFSVSCTTRKQRPSEVDGKDYFFLSKEEFLKKKENNEFAESEEIFGNLYGTLKSEIEDKIKNGKTVLFDVDVKGAISLQNAYPDDTVLIFIQAPSEAVLRERLLKRGTETEEEIDNRIARAQKELKHKDCFDYILVNDVLEITLREVKKISEMHI